MSNKKCNKCVHSTVCAFNDNKHNGELCPHFLTLDTTKVKQKFTFETDIDWKPMKAVCWVDCPFNFFIGLGNYCKCLDGNVKCPFVNNIETEW